MTVSLYSALPVCTGWPSGTHSGPASRRPHPCTQSSVLTTQMLLVPLAKLVPCPQGWGPYLSVARRPTGTHCGPASRRPHAHSDSSMLTTQALLAPWARSAISTVLLMSKCSTRRAALAVGSWYSSLAGPAMYLRASDTLCALNPKP